SAEPGAVPILGEPYNPDTYPAMLEAQGYHVSQRYVTQLVSLQGVRKAVAMVEPVRDALIAEGYRFEIPTHESWVRSMPQFYEMVDSIFKGSFAYRRLSYPEFARLVGPTLLTTLSPRCSVFVF